LVCCRVGVAGGWGVALLVFFFQAEDGIRDWSVTGVQTCALPIFERPEDRLAVADDHRAAANAVRDIRPRRRERQHDAHLRADGRSEERRVGKEWRYGGGRWQ